MRFVPRVEVIDTLIASMWGDWRNANANKCALGFQLYRIILNAQRRDASIDGRRRRRQEMKCAWGPRRDSSRRKESRRIRIDCGTFTKPNAPRFEDVLPYDFEFQWIAPVKDFIRFQNQYSKVVWTYYIKHLLLIDANTILGFFVDLPETKENYY